MVRAGGYNKVSGLGGLVNNRNSLLVVLEAESLGSGCQHGCGLLRTLFWVATCAKRAGELSTVYL